MSKHGIKGVYLYSGQDIEDFIQAHNGRWPIRGYAYLREVLYHRKRDGGITVRRIPTLFISCNSSTSERMPADSEYVKGEYGNDLSTYSSEELGYF